MRASPCFDITNAFWIGPVSLIRPFRPPSPAVAQGSETGTPALVGLVTLYDLPRPDAQQLIQWCQRKGEQACAKLILQAANATSSRSSSLPWTQSQQQQEQQQHNKMTSPASLHGVISETALLARNVSRNIARAVDVSGRH